MKSCKHHMILAVLLQIMVLFSASFSVYAKVNATKPTKNTKASVAPTPVKKISAIVKLSTIKAIELNEQGVDEIYFNVTSYSSLGASKNRRIPAGDLCWESKNLEKVKDVVLWEGDLQKAEELKLVLSVVEQDFPPWDPDELIGGAQLLLKNNKGNFSHEWVAPVFEEEVDIEMKGKRPDGSQIFLLKGAGAIYEVTFSVAQK